MLRCDLAAGRGGLNAQVLICADVVARQARHHGHSRARELALCIVHGLLHLTGHEDATPTKAAATHARQEQLLAEFTAREKRRRR